MNDDILKIRNLQKIYNGRTILNIESLNFQRKNIYAVVGLNGSGKSTLLNILNMLLIPNSGQVFFHGQDIINKINKNNLEYRRKMTLVDQNPLLFHFTVADNIAYGLKIRGLPLIEQNKRIKDALDMVGLPGFENRRINHLSGGEAQRIVIARALVIQPEILFLDEPTANIDRRYIDVIERIIKKINNEMGTTVIFTTHDLSQAYRLADEIISLVEGKITQKIPENIFRGEVVKENDCKWFKVNEKIHFNIITEKLGQVYIYIDPKDIILSLKPFQSSARNMFFGKIIKIAKQNHLIKIEVDIGVPLVVIITNVSFRDMKLNLGSNIYLTFKASAIKIF